MLQNHSSVLTQVFIKPNHIQANCELMVCAHTCMCHVRACTDASRREAPQKQFYFSKSEDTGADWARHSRAVGKEMLRAAPALSQRTLVARGPALQKEAGPPNWGASVRSRDYPVSAVRCLHPCPQHEVGRAQERGALGVSSSLRGGGLREASLQPDPLVPHILVVPGTVLAAWQLRNGECGYQQFTAETHPPLRPLSPRAGGPAPGASCCKGERLLGNKAQQDPTPGASILVGRYKRKYCQHQPKRCLAARRGPWSHGEKRFWPRGAAATREGGGRGRVSPSPNPPVACRRLPQGPHSWSGAGPGTPGGSQERPRSRSCGRVSPPPLLSTRRSQPPATNTQWLEQEHSKILSCL